MSVDVDLLDQLLAIGACPCRLVPAPVDWCLPLSILVFHRTKTQSQLVFTHICLLSATACPMSVRDLISACVVCTQEWSILTISNGAGGSFSLFRTRKYASSVRNKD